MCLMLANSVTEHGQQMNLSGYLMETTRFSFLIDAYELIGTPIQMALSKVMTKKCNKKMSKERINNLVTHTL